MPKEVHLGHIDDPHKAIDKFFGKVKELKVKGDIDQEVPLAVDGEGGFLQLMEQELGQELDAKKRLFGILKDQQRLYLTFAGERIGYYVITQENEMRRLGEFLYTLANVDEEAEKAQVNKWIAKELQSYYTQIKLDRLFASSTTGPTKYSAKKDKEAYIEAEDDLEKSNTAQARALLKKAKLLAEQAETSLAANVEAELTESMESLEQIAIKLDNLTTEMARTDVTPQHSAELKDQKISLIMEIVQAKIRIDRLDLPTGAFRDSKTQMEKAVNKYLESLGYTKKGFLFGRSIRKDDRLQRIHDYIEDLEMVSLGVGKNPRKFAQAEKRIQEFEATFVYGTKGLVTPYRKITKQVDRKNLSTTGVVGGRPAGRGNRIDYINAARELNGLDPAYYLVASGYLDYDTGGVGSRATEARGEPLDIPGIKVVVNKKTGVPEVVTDVTQLPPRLLVEGYFIAKAAAQSSNAPRRARNDNFRYAYGIFDEVTQHPENTKLIVEMLANGGGLTSGEEELQYIMGTVLFSEDFQKKVKANYRALKKDVEHNHDIPELSIGNPNLVNDIESTLREIAFTRNVPAQAAYLSSRIERNTTGDKNTTYGRHESIKRFFNDMGVKDIATFVVDNMDAVDPNSDVSVGDSFKYNGITKKGGVFDNVEARINDRVETQNRGPGRKEFAKNTNGVLNTAGKVMYKGAGVLSLGLAVWNGVGGVFRSVRSLFTAPGQGQTRLGNFFNTLGDSILGPQVTPGPGMANFFNRRYYGGALAPFLTWMGLGAADKGRQTTDWLHTFLYPFDEDSKAFIDSKNEIRAVDSQSQSPQEGVNLTIADMPLSQLAGTVLVEKDGTLFVDLKQLDAGRRAARTPAKLAGTQVETLDQLGKGLGTFLRNNYELTPTMIQTLSQQYPGATLGELMKRYVEHEKPTTLLDTALPGNMLTDEEVLMMRYMEENEFLAKREQLAFVGQQFEKLKPTALDAFRTTTSGFPLSTTIISSADLLQYLQKVKDPNGVKAYDRLMDRLEAISDLDAATSVAEFQGLMEGYFAVLSTPFRHEGLSVDDPYATTSPAPRVNLLRRYDVDGSGNDYYENSLAQYFHDPSIGNGTGSNLLVDIPVRGDVRQNDIDAGAIASRTQSGADGFSALLDSQTDTTTADRDTIGG